MRMWKEFTYPHLKRLVDAIHEAGALAALHSCGFQMPFLPHYVEAGVDLLQAFQPKAGNDFAKAYGEFGDRLTFVTGIDVQQGERFSPAEFKASIIDAYRTAGRRGRHILGTTHEVQHTMPDANLNAMLEALDEIGAGRHDA
jgi:uroporphyrinogen decarboxylase